MNPIIVSLPNNEALASALAEGLSAQTVSLQLRQYPDGETYLRVAQPVAGRDVLIACSLDHPDAKLVPLYLLASTLRGMGARRIVLAAPYLAYMRQDQIFNAGESASAAHIARWLSDFLDGLVTVEPHLHRIRSLPEIYRIPAVAVRAAPAIGRWIRENVARPFLIGPDEESRPWVEEAARTIGCRYVVLHKVRSGDHAVSVSIPSPADGLDCTPVLVDDIISTGHTMAEAIRQLRILGFAAPVCVAVHAIFADDAHQFLVHAGAERVVSCNTVAHQTNTIDVLGELTWAVRELLA